MEIRSARAIEPPSSLPITDCASPNHGVRKNGKTPDAIILHYTGVPTAEAAVALLCDPRTEVSAHYVILPDGRILRLVPEPRRAWHAGRGYWAGETDMNDVSIGVEIAHPGHRDGRAAFPYPDAQIASVIALCQDVSSRWAIAPERVLAHSDIAPDRKIDPGEFFPWNQLGEAGVGCYVPPCPITEGPRLARGAQGEEVEAMQAMLARYGYGVSQSGVLDESSECALRAFQRHFRPALIDGVADVSTLATLRRLLARLGRTRNPPVGESVAFA